MTMADWGGDWIWSSESLPARNAFVRFRRRFAYSGGPARLRITADSRYVLYVNGTYIGQGPVRAWPAHWRYDSYDIEPYLRPGENVLAVRVNHYGEGTFQYNPGPAGLLAQLELTGQVVVSDGNWRAAPDLAFVNPTPRISVQEGFEEQYDARLDEGWTETGFDDGAWPHALGLRPAADGQHADLGPRGIPYLTLEPALPQRIVSAEAVRSLPYRHTIYVKPYLAPQDFTSNAMLSHAYLATQVWSPAATPIRFIMPHKQPAALKVNGRLVEGDEAQLHAGWNSLVASLHGIFHLHEFSLCFDGPEGLRLSATGAAPAAGGAASSWAVVGPFALSDEDIRRSEGYVHTTLIMAAPIGPAASEAAGDAFWETADVAAVAGAPFFQPVRAEHLPPEDVFLQAYTDTPVEGAVRVDNGDRLLSGSDWATVYPAGDHDVRLLLDFGQEIDGYHRFEIMARAGAVLDLHNFEFIQPDGRYNFAEGMNNSCRYICRDGVQAYQTYVRRGFRYTYLILRHVQGPVRLRRIEALYSSYPQARRGNFACSDAQLDRIWQAGADTLRACAEDTYVDCPTYEQTHWVGDARNEALVDWVVNGDPRLWFRCLEQTGQSLDRSPITESHVPSAWQNILPAWSFLWMRSCAEYLTYTGDREGSLRLLSYLERNVAGVRQHLDAEGLFNIRAWNMFDWADMDTPPSGVVTHQNCLAVHGLKDAADMAETLGRAGLARDWRNLAASLSAAINRRLWNEEQQAYTDCLRDGRHSPVFSQQTQTAAYISGVATGERARRCWQIMQEPPEGFVKAGSPFFEFFLLEGYQREGKEQEFVDTVRRDWGFMIDMGATTFWEMWSGHSGRLTRSHCHGWSAAPTFFLSTYVLGVQPGGVGFAPVIVEPHTGGLSWCRGAVPTPAGDVEVQWEDRPGEPFALRVKAPAGVQVTVRLPRPGQATLNGQAIAA